MGPLRRLFAGSVSFLIFAFAVAVPVFAQPADSTGADSARYRLPPVVVTAQRPRADRPRPVGGDGDRPRADRPRAGALRPDELRHVPSVDVQRSGSGGKLTDVRLRGADPRHTLVLFDGIPLNRPWAGTFDFADLPARMGQIEVMGGPASSLYGTGAVGG